MKQPQVYSIDYTLISECESRLYELQTSLNNDDTLTAAELVLECRSMLQRTLDRDILMTPDDDIFPGYVKETDMYNYIKAIQRDMKTNNKAMAKKVPRR